MIDSGLFKEMLKMLSDVHTYWKPLGDVAQAAMLSQLNKYGVDDDAFGNYCLKVMGDPNLQPANIVEHFQSEYVRISRQKALPSTQIKTDLQSQQFVRFQRFYNQLQSNLAQGQSYPVDKNEFHELWTEPLEDSDWAYAQDRLESVLGGLGISLGGVAL